jgi:hypothetical protein
LSSNAAHSGAANLKEDLMLKITRHDLHRKSDRQLAALFQQATRNVSRESDSSSAKPDALLLVAMIREELAQRLPTL